MQVGQAVAKVCFFLLQELSNSFFQNQAVDGIPGL